MTAAVNEKNDVRHFDREDTLVTDRGDRPTSVHEDQGGEGAKDKAGKLLISTAPKDGDLGGRWLAQYTGIRPELTDELNSKIRNRIDAHLLPLIFLIYFNQQQDKSSVAFAAVFGFRDDANLQGNDYSMLTTIIYIAQLVFQPCECNRLFFLCRRTSLMTSICVRSREIQSESQHLSLSCAMLIISRSTTGSVSAFLGGQLRV